MEGFTEQVGDLLATSSHSLLVQLLQPVLLPLLTLVLEGSYAARAADPAAAYSAETLSAEAKRGAAWVLLGAARLHLASPPPGADPAAKYAHKRAHLLAVLDDVLAELEVSTQGILCFSLFCVQVVPCIFSRTRSAMQESKHQFLGLNLLFKISVGLRLKPNSRIRRL